MDAKYDVLAWNELATLLHRRPRLGAGERAQHHPVDVPPSRADDPHWTDEEPVRFVRACVADLRAAYARYPGDRGIAELVTELNGTSPRFAEMWADHEVEARRPITKRVDHPVAGPLEFECQVLYVPDTDQRLIIYCAAPGSPTEAAFRRVSGSRGPSCRELASGSGSSVTVSV